MKRIEVQRLFLAPGFAVLSLACLPALLTVASAQSSSVKVSPPSTQSTHCQNSNLQASAPKTKVSAPNPSRLVPNVGKLLRKGVGVPAPDAEAPDVGSPSVKVSRTNVKCSNVNTPSSGSSSKGSSSNSSEIGTSGLW
jgi:hypothetical protein